MANEARRTATQMLTAVRTNLDEATAAWWTDANLYSVLTRAAHAVATEIRRLKSDWFVRSLASTDSPITVYTETYTPSTALALAANTMEYALPPDLLELKLIECITSGYESVVFEFRDMTDGTFRALRANPDAQEPSGFLCDVIGERTLTLAPKPNRALDVRIWYVSSAVIRSSADAFIQDFSTGTDMLVMPFPGYMAVEEVATARAMVRDRDATAAAYAAMADQSVARLFGANARQTMDYEVVRGVFE